MVRLSDSLDLADVLILQGNLLRDPLLLRWLDLACRTDGEDLS